MDSQSAKELRLALGWSQDQMAEFLGVKQPTVARIEAGQEIPSPIKKLLMLLKAQSEQQAA